MNHKLQKRLKLLIQNSTGIAGKHKTISQGQLAENHDYIIGTDRFW